jgi:Protein of unknown function (DUF3050)
MTVQPGAKLNMAKHDREHLATLRAKLLDHSIYAEVASVADLRRFMEDHVFAVWDFMSLLKRLQQDMTCTRVPWFPADSPRAARPIPEMFSRLLKTVRDARHANGPLRHFIYYIDRHIELDGDSHGPKGRALLDELVAASPQRNKRALRAACNSIDARIELWNGTLSKLREMRVAEASSARAVPAA